MAPGADPLVALRDIREPHTTLEMILADALMAVAAGLLLAVIIACLAQLILRRKRSKRDAALAGLEMTRHLPADDRLFAQAAVLKKVASHLPPVPYDTPSTDRLEWTSRLDSWFGSDFFAKGTGARLRETLYRRDKTVDPDLVDKELVRLLRGVKD